MKRPRPVHRNTIRRELKRIDGMLQRESLAPDSRDRTRLDAFRQVLGWVLGANYAKPSICTSEKPRRGGER